MGRRQYRQDLATAAQNPPPHIGNIHSPDDGEIAFSYNYSQGGVNHVAQLQLLALNVDDYPRENEYMIFARDTEASPPIANVISILSPILANRSITDALSEISNCLYQAVTKGKSSNPILLDSSDVDEEDPGAQDEEEGDDWLEDDDDATFGLDQSTKLGPITIGRTSMSHMAAENRQKVKADLVQAKSAGFKIGIIGDLNSSGIVCVSIRVSKLGISEEVMKAWGLEARQYLVLLIRLQYGYRSIESLKEESILAGATEIRLGLCYSYKPDPQSAFDSFNELAQKTTVESQVTKLRSSTSLQALFIGRPLNELFRGRFTRIVKFRDVYQLGWTGAEQLVHDTQGAIADTKGMEKYDRMCDNEVPRALPEIVMQDTMSDRPIKDCSLPLVAMQFALRHFVRCTEFCLVCHCSSGSTFEALKPYVCSNPLCLYQYMGLGFGPSIEWEILSQPYVVDLLISFCYAQAQGGRLKEFPDGIDLRVPVLPQYCKDIGAGIGYHHYGQQAEAQGLTKSSTAQKSFTAPYSPEKCELWFTTDEADTTKQLRTGDFIALSRPANINGVVYHRIEDVMSPVVMLGPPVLTGEIASDGTRNKPTMSGYTLVDCYLFSHNFDELSKDHKAKAIMGYARHAATGQRNATIPEDL